MMGVLFVRRIMDIKRFMDFCDDCMPHESGDMVLYEDNVEIVEKLKREIVSLYLTLGYEVSMDEIKGME